MVKILDEAVRLHKLGMDIIWLRPRSKMPVKKGWTQGERVDLETLKKTYRPGFNAGVRLGATSQVAGGYLAVLDVDIKSEDPKHKAEALHTLFNLFPEAEKAPFLLSGRGNGSAHYYVRLEKPVSGNDTKAKSHDIIKVLMPSVAANQTERDQLTLSEIAIGIRLRRAWEISLLSQGRQSVIAGSVHPDTGNQYSWGKAVNGSGEDIPFIKPETPAMESFGKRQGAVLSKDRITQTKFEDVDLESLGLRDDQIAAIVSGTGVMDRSGEIFGLCMALLRRKVSEEKILSIFTDRQYYLGNAAYEHAKTNDRQRAANWLRRYSLEKAKATVEETDFDIEEIPATPHGKQSEVIDSHRVPKKKLALPKGVTGEHDWELELETKNKPPVVKCTFINLKLILGHKAERPDFLKFDLFSLNTHYTCDTPWGPKKGDQRSGGTEDALKVKSWLADIYGIEPTLNMIDEVLNNVALQNTIHPLRDYLNSLEWDGVERISTAFRRYLGADMPEPYLSDVTRKFFLACVKRAFEPGCKFDHVPVLEGDQGIGKSTFGSILAGQWFLDALPNLADKDAALYLQGIWICELGELAAMYRSATEITKNFISRQHDKFREPYGRRRKDFPRTTVFLGTTNARDYLIDPSGNRRWWPVAVHKCDFEALKRDRDQLWAEAVFNYQFCNEPLYLTGEARHQAELIQDLRMIDDDGEIMSERLASWIKEQKDLAGKKYSLSEFFSGPFIMLPQNRVNMQTAANILRRAGFRKIHTESGKRWVAE